MERQAAAASAAVWKRWLMSRIRQRLTQAWSCWGKGLPLACSRVRGSALVFIWTSSTMLRALWGRCPVSAWNTSVPSA